MKSVGHIVSQNFNRTFFHQKELDLTPDAWSSRQYNITLFPIAKLLHILHYYFEFLIKPLQVKL